MARGALVISTFASAVGCTVVQDIQAPQPPVRPPDGLFEGLLTGRTAILDLTHPLDADNPYWPGEGYSPFAYETLYTGWDERWDDFDSYRNEDDEGQMHFPGFSPEATALLVEDRDVAGLGIDTLSVDYGLSTGFDVHAVSHGQGKYHIENAANLEDLPPTGAWVVVAPIHIRDATGGPVRIFALVEAAGESL
jgi:kynurenine formamidase